MPEILGRLRPPRLNSSPTTPALGEQYYDTTANQLFYWNGTSWIAGAGGSNWYTYTGGGTPAPGAVNASEKDGDMAVRRSDGEIFQRTAGAWVDQGWSTIGQVYDTDPVGTVKAYSGSTIPTNWMIADGRALQRASYPDLFAALGGTSSPWGLPDSNTFNLPDLRGRMIVGAGAGTGLTSRPLSNTGGEERHAILMAEMPSHSHRSDGLGGTAGTASGGATVAGRTSNDDVDHMHYVYGNTGGQSTNHTHNLSLGGYNYGVSSGGNNLFSANVWNNPQTGHTMGVFSNGATSDGNTNWADRDHSHLNQFWSNSQDNANPYPGWITRHSHPMPAMGIYAAGGSSGVTQTHENMPPWCAVALIIKVLGVQVNAGGALQGATGQRGTTWYIYNGIGTPPPGTFVGELDGDWCIRKSDGETFQRVGGVWVDQNFTNRSTAAVTCARGYRSGTQTIPASTGTKILIDNVTFDTTNGGLSTSTGVFTCPVAGYYLVNVNLVLNASATGTYTEIAPLIFKNGNQVSAAISQPAVQTYAGGAYSDVIQCAAGDTLGMGLFCVGQSLSINASSQWNSFEVTLITAGPGPQGQRGANWFTYTGAGTPAANTFPNELDGDMAVRSSDGEVFTRVSGAWVDQNWTMRNGQQTLDTWHLVGQSGQAPFTNSWVNYGGGFNVCGYRKFPDGRVQLKGLVTSGALNTSIFTLPPGYRPVATQLIDSMGNQAAARLDISPSGTVVPTIAGPWVTLDNVTFDTELVTTMATGRRGANWFTYTGAGVPAAGTFTGEQDDDMAVRSSDGEVFKRVSGAWVDQNYSAARGMATSPIVAKSRRATAISGGAGWNKIVLDTQVFDTGATAGVGAICDIANGRMICPVSGYYQINAEVGEVAAELLIDIVINGSLDVVNSPRGTRTPNTPSNTANGVAAMTHFLNKGDTIELYAWLGAAASITAFPSTTWMTLALIQPGVGIGVPAGGTTNQALVKKSGTDYDTQWANQTGGHTIQDEGIALSQRQGLNFVGAGVIATDDSANNRTIVTIGGGGGGAAGAATAVAARMYRNAAYTTSGTAGTYTKVPLDAISFDTSQIASIANGRIQIATGGYYQVDAAVEGNAASSGVGAAIYKNGVMVTAPGISYGGAGQAFQASAISDTIQCSAGDYLELYCYGATASISVPVGSGSVFLAVQQVGSANMTSGPVTPARVYRGSTQNLTGAQYNKITFDTADFDPGGNFNAASSRYVCPVSGYYQVNSVISLQTATTCQVGIYKNGTLVATSDNAPAASGWPYCAISDVLSCNAGDYIEMYCYPGAAATTLAQKQQTYMSVVQVGNLSSVSAPTSTMCARAYRNTSLAPAANTWTKIGLDSITYDTSGLVSITNGRIQISQSGYYSINASVGWAASAATVMTLVSVWKNGTEIFRGKQGIETGDGGNTRTDDGSDIVQLNAGDYIELYAYAGSTFSIQPGPMYCYLAVALLTSLSGAVGPVTPARMYRSAALNSSVNWYKIPFDTIAYDPGNNCSIANGRYTAPATGYYQVNGAVYSGGTQTSVQIYKNGAQWAEGVTTTGASADVNDVVQMNAGDYVEIWAWNSSGAGQTITVGAAYTYMSVTQVGNLSSVSAPTSTMCARMFRSATAPALSNGVWTKMPLDAVSYDTSGMASTANGRIQISQAGYYQVEGTSQLAATATNQQWSTAIYKNGSPVAYAQTSMSVAGLFGIPIASDLIQCNAGDYLELWVNGPAATPSAGASVTYLSASLVTALSGAVGPTTPARMGRSAAYTTAAGGWNKFPFDIINSDPGGNCSLANGRYTCPATGTYMVNWNMSSAPGPANTDAAVNTQIYKNGVAWSKIYRFGRTDINGWLGASGADTIPCNAGDYIELWISAQGAYANTACDMSVTQVGNQMATPASTVCARAYRNAALTLTPASSFVKVPIDTTDYDTSGIVQTANGRMVAPVAGYYKISGDVIVSPSAISTDVTFFAAAYVNGTRRLTGTIVGRTTSDSTASSAFSDVLRLNAGDYVELYGYSSGVYGLYTGAPGVYNCLTMTLMTPLSGTAGPVTAARAYRNAAFTPAGTGWGMIPTDTADFDPGNNLSATKDRYTCPATGYYQFSGSIQISAPAAGTQYAAGIYKNGTQVATGGVVATPAGAGAMTGVSVLVSEIVSCNAGDYLQLALYESAVLALANPGPLATYFTVAQVGNSMNFSSAGGDLQGTYPNPTLKAGAASSNLGAAGGDLTGTYPSPTIAKQPAIKVTLSATTAAISAAAAVPFNTTAWSQGGMSLDATGMVKVPVAGVYRVSAEILVNSTAPTGRCDGSVGNWTQNTAWKVGGASPGDGSVADGGVIIYFTTGNFQTITVTGLVQANANDLIGAMFVPRSGAAPIYGTGSWTSMAIEKVSN